MKKRFLVICLITILVSMLIVLTGCGNQSNEQNTEDSDKNVQSDIKTQNENNAGVSITISKVISPFNDKIAVVKSDSNYYVIDNNGKVLSDISQYVTSDTKIQTSGDYIVINPYDYDLSSINISNGTSLVLDKNGKVILDKDKNAAYGKISNSGFLSVRRVENGISGNTYKKNIEDVNGNIIKSSDINYGEFKYIGGDIFFFNGDEGLLFNAKTKAELKIPEIYNHYRYDFNPKYIIGKIIYDAELIIDEDLQKSYNVSDKDIKIEGIIDEKYTICQKDDVYGIYDYNGNFVKEIQGNKSQTGYVINVAEYNNNYYIKTNTNYFYSLDKDLNEIASPFEISGVLISTNIGIVSHNSNNWVVLDEKGQESKTLFTFTKFQDLDFDCMEENFETYMVGDYMYLKTGIYDLKNQSMLDITK